MCCALLLGGAPALAAPTPAPTPPAPAECLSPNMICDNVDGAWVTDFRPRPPLDHTVPNDVVPVPIFILFGAFTLFLIALNLISVLRRRSATGHSHHPGAIGVARRTLCR